MSRNGEFLAEIVNLSTLCLDNNNKWTKRSGYRRCRTRTNVCNNKSSSSNSSNSKLNNINNSNSSIMDQICLQSTGVLIIMTISNKTTEVVITRALQLNCTIRRLQLLALNATAQPNILRFIRTKTREVAFSRECISSELNKTFTIVARLTISQCTLTRRR